MRLKLAKKFKKANPTQNLLVLIKKEYNLLKRLFKEIQLEIGFIEDMRTT